MRGFTKLELAALQSIFSETPLLRPLLETQLDAAEVIARENTGGGFFTTIAVDENVFPFASPRVLGYETHARVTGSENGFSFILFLEGGRIQLLEGVCWDLKDSRGLDLWTTEFVVYREPVTRIE